MTRDQQVLQNIERYGCHVIHVLPSEENDHSPWAYSIGIEHSLQQPEVFIIGLKQPLAHSIVNAYCRRLRGGERFEHGMHVSGLLEGFTCEIRNSHPSHYEDYFGQDLRFYDGPHFRMVQIVYPNTSGIWPWDAEADEWFRARQPLLDKPRP